MNDLVNKKMAFRLIQEGDRKANKRVGSYLSVIYRPVCSQAKHVVGTALRLRFLSRMVSSVNVSLQPMPFGDAPSENTENLPRKIQSSGQYFQQGLTLLEALCSSS